MTSPVISVKPSATIAEAARLMLDHSISGLPVVDADGVLRGMVTEGDFLQRAELGTEIRRARWLRMISGPDRFQRRASNAMAVTRPTSRPRCRA